jgi:hypothetical protein
MNKSQNVYAFIDNQNLNATVNNLGWKIDWRKFRQYLSSKYDVKCAYMFIGYMPEHEDMYEKLHDAGYNIVLKQSRQKKKKTKIKKKKNATLRVM